MVNTLNHDNPTQLLLSAIKQSGLNTHVSGSFKEEEDFCLGALSLDGKVCPFLRSSLPELSRSVGRPCVQNHSWRPIPR